MPGLVFILAIILILTIFERDQQVKKALRQASDILLSESEIQRRKDGALVNYVSNLLPRLEQFFDIERLSGAELKRMLKLMGEPKSPERVYADHIVTALLAASGLLAIPLVTGKWLFILFYPIAVALIMFGQYQMVRRRFKNWQNDVVKDLPELIDKMRISLASGKDYISALRKVQENSGPRLSKILEKLINDMQIMRPTKALDEFSQAFGLPVMVKFTAAIKIGIEVGYDNAENYFDHIEQDIRYLRKLALEELTKNKPERVNGLKVLMITHALAALTLTALNLFSKLNNLL